MSLGDYCIQVPTEPAIVEYFKDHLHFEKNWTYEEWYARANSKNVGKEEKPKPIIHLYCKIKGVE